MQISEKLKQHIITEFKKRESELLERINSIVGLAGTYVKIPIAIDGVIDTVTYDMNEKRFCEISISVASEGIVDSFIPGTAYCDKAKTVTIKI